MKIKKENGYTGIDIAISIVVLFIFVSIIAFLSYNINSNSKEIDLKTQALDIAVDEIEQIKNDNFERFNGINKNSSQDVYGNELGKKDSEGNILSGKKEVKEGFYRTIFVEDYNDMQSEKIANIVKKITVVVSYKFKGNIQTVELSTILSKET